MSSRLRKIKSISNIAKSSENRTSAGQYGICRDYCELSIKNYIVTLTLLHEDQRQWKRNRLTIKFKGVIRSFLLLPDLFGVQLSLEITSYIKKCDLSPLSFVN